jgi:hypothetical protein
MTWLPSDMVTKWHLESVGECGCGCGWMWVWVRVRVGVCGWGLEFRVRCIAPTEKRRSRLPCHLVTMPLGNHVTW